MRLVWPYTKAILFGSSKRRRGWMNERKYTGRGYTAFRTD